MDAMILSLAAMVWLAAVAWNQTFKLVRKVDRLNYEVLQDRADRRNAERSKVDEQIEAVVTMKTHDLVSLTLFTKHRQEITDGLTEGCTIKVTISKDEG